uniref:Uncharacterized protein n=1 Tax=Rhizophora mucronata TaxID=61149 RepID=A0A2P2Q2W3_RHIMU
MLHLLTLGKSKIRQVSRVFVPKHAS